MVIFSVSDNGFFVKASNDFKLLILAIAYIYKCDQKKTLISFVKIIVKPFLL